MIVTCNGCRRDTFVGSGAVALCQWCGASLTPPEVDDYEDPAYEEYLRAMEKRSAELRATPRPEGLTVHTHTGTEGPRDDPYSYSLCKVTMPDGRVVSYRAGMIEELRVNGEELMRGGGWGSSEPSICEAFERIVGYPLDQLEWWADEPYRGVPCMACGREGCRGRCCE